jgi:uncharacterized protein
MDVTQAAKDFPDLNFLIYHSGFKGLQDSLPAAENGFKQTSYIPWVSDICDWKKKVTRGKQHLYGDGQHVCTNGFKQSITDRPRVGHDY